MKAVQIKFNVPGAESLWVAVDISLTRLLREMNFLDGLMRERKFPRSVTALTTAGILYAHRRCMAKDFEVEHRLVVSYPMDGKPAHICVDGTWSFDLSDWQSGLYSMAVESYYCEGEHDCIPF